MRLTRAFLRRGMAVGMILAAPPALWVPSARPGRSQPGQIDQLIEQRDRSGRIVARLRVTSGASPGEFGFEIEDLVRSTRATGRGKVSEALMDVQIVESRSRMRVGLRTEAGQGTDRDPRITLSLDRLEFHFVLDKRARSLIDELKSLAASGADDARLIPLARQLDTALRIRTGYRPFVEQVRASTASEILSTLRSLIVTVPYDEAGQNPALVTLRMFCGFFSLGWPSASSSTATSGIITRNRAVSVAYWGGRALPSAQGGSNCGPTIDCTTCFWSTVQNTCGPLSTLPEIACITMAAIEWFVCVLF
ncbi:hypothetical protein HRbin10_01682 [bacterium HR10]|nr:hypothetical protein HRbin10_01682 [bacterium HR10]